MIDKHGTIYVDNSLMRATARCQTEDALRHVLGLTVIAEEAPQLEVGTAIHEVMADYFAGKPAEWCLTKFELLYHGQSEEWGLEDPKHPQTRLSYTNVDKILKEWFERHPMAGFPFGVRPGLIEVGFQLPLNDECVCGHKQAAHAQDGRCKFRGRCKCTEFHPAFVFYGRLDAIVQAQHDGSLYVLDHKTTGRLTPWWAEDYRNDSQMSGYIWAAQQTTGMKVVGVFINAIELSKLPSDPVRKCRDHGVVYAECGPLHMKSELLIFTRSPEQLEEWRQTALDLARRHKALVGRVKTIEDLTSVRTDGTFHRACSLCNFKKFCDAGRPLHYVDSMLTFRPWAPFDIEEPKK